MAVDDFVMTIDDEEVVETQDEDTAPQTKRKRGDEELNPAFTFNVGSVMTHGNSVWDFTAAKDMMKKSDQGDIDEIIARKRKARAQAMVKKVMDVESDGEGVKDMDEEDEFYSANSGSDEGEEQENEDEDDDEEVIASDDEDLAVDGFGGGAASDDEEPDGEDAEEKEAMSDSGDGDEDEEDDEVDGAMSDDQSEESEEETELEKERKRAYFAPEDDQPTETHESFASMNLSRPILKGLAHVGFIQPTAIQAKTIPLALLGKDICGGAVTGSGKTAAFIVPILERLLYRPRSTAATRVLILCPTRELAIQVHSVAVKLASFTDMTFCLCVGGLSLKVQEQELKQRPDAVIATPGRLIDHIRNSSGFSTDHIEILVMDEADRMLEDGFADELGEIIKNTPKSRQTMLFSATMTDNVDSLIRMSLNRPVRLMIDKVSQASSKLVQEFVRIRQHREPDRPAVLLALVTKTFKKRTIIFFRSKAAAHQMKILFGLCGLNAAELHGNLTQEQRLDALEKFRDGNVDFLLATDLASRGLDIKGIETVINFNMPQQFAQYLHRVGRTARAGRNGRSVTLVGEADRKLLKLAVKSSPSSQIKHRLVPADLIGKFRAKVDDLTEDVKAVLQEEKEERALRQAEMEVKKSENMMEHQDEIFSRPARTWFQSEKDKKKAAKAADPSKPARDKMSGLSRAKRRRLESLKDIDAETQATQSKAIRSAKKSSLPAKLNATKNSDLVNAGLKHIREKMEKAKKRNKFKNVGFKMDLADSGKSGAVGLASKVNKQKKVSGKQGKQGKKGNKSGRSMESFDESDLRKRKLNHLEDTSDGNAAHSNIATGAWIPPLGPRNPPLLNGAGKPPQGPYASPFAQLTSSAFSSPFVARPASETFEPARSKPPHQRSSAFGVTHAPTPLPKMPVTPFVDLTLEHHASRQRTPHAPYHPPSTSMYSPYYRSPSTSLPTTPAPAPPSVPYSSSPAMSQYREPAQTASTTGTGTATPTVLSDTSDDDVVIDEVKTNAPLCFGLLRTEMIVLRPLGLPADDGFEPAACVLEGRRGDNYSMKINNRQGMFMGWLPFTLTNILGPLIEGRLCWVDAVIPRVRPQHTRSNPIHLIIYGPPRATMTVSDLLLTNHFVLREPAFYNPATRYLNPHAQINRIPGVGPDSSSNLLRTSQQTQRDIKELLSSIPNDTEVDTEALLGRKADIDNTDPNAGSLAAPIDGMTVGLLPHQVKGVAWMLSCERNPNINGGILADDMGLGKTIQSIALILRRKPETEKRRSTLIVSPLALIRQWESEINTKTTPGDLSVHVHHGPNRTRSAEKLASYDIVITTYQVVASEFPVIAHKKKKRRKKVDEEDTNGGDKSSEVVVLDDTEDTTADEGRSEETRSAVMEEYNNAEMQLQYNHDKVFSELPADKGFGPLFGVGWYRVILDEAQQIKNQNTRAAQTTSHLFATKRWCLTGTPLQNNVEELYSLLKFLRVKPWSEYSIFKEQISRPLQSGQGNLAMQRLRVVLKATMLRRTKAVLRGDQSQNVSRANSPTRDAGDVSETTSANPSRLGSPNGDSSTDTPKPDTPEAHTFLNLPERHIEVVETQFSKEERVLYDLLNAKTRKTLAELLRAPKKSERNYLNMLCLLLRLRQACNHPQLVLKALKSETDALELETGQTAKLAAKEQHKEISNRAMMMYVGSGLGWDLSALDPLSAVPPGRCDICLTSLPDASLSMCADCEHKIRKAANVAVKSESANEPTNDTSTHVKPETASEPSNPSPQPAFPLSTKISKLLDILEDTRRQAPTEKTIVFSQFTSMLDLLEGPLGERGFKFCRYDGTMQNNVREKSLAALKKDPSTTVMLISLKCGSLGLNLTAANRVVLMDVWWNPAVEDQAIDRVHRIGQRLPVHVTRLKIMDTVEDKIIQLQEKKRALIQGALGDSDSLRVNKLTMQEIKYLFS